MTFFDYYIHSYRSSLTELEIEDNLVKIGDYDEIERLVLDQSRQRTVINLTGKSGIGKTTLASYLYRRNSIRKHFACTAWVHVPRKFRFADLLHDVIRQANASSGDDELGGEAADDDVRRRGGMEAERLVKARLAAALQGKRYLVVLDDVRSREEWAFFLAALPGGLAGSCVLVTTQVKISEESEQPVAAGGGVVRTRELGKLRPEQAAELFRRRVYGHGEPEPKKMEQLKSLVDSMTKGSNLPLNIVMLAGLLRSKKEDEWEAVIHSLDDTPPPTSPEQTPPEAEPKKDSLDDSETAPTSTEQTKKTKKRKQMATSMDKILTVCMDDLPTHLKPCFLYFAGFTAQTPICAGKLVRLWVAEGFMQAKNGQTVEEHGEECLKELISRCLVQLVETDAGGGRVAAVSIHQAVLDFVQAEARDTNFLHVHSGAAGLSNGAARRLALRNTYDTDLAVMLEAPKLHTLLCDIPERAAADAAGAAAWQRALELINGRAPTFSVHGSRFLRVMDLKGVRLPHRESLPEEIGWLIHLRYLGLSHTTMRHLPSSVKRLRNLQTLDVSRTDVEALPWRLWRNPSLRHVMARRLAAWSAPDERAVLPDLQTLHGVPWGRWARAAAAAAPSGR